jgi:hypothetical protein
MAKILTHLPGCASLDVAATDAKDWDDPDYKPVACNCGAAERDKKRRANRGSALRGEIGTRETLGEKIGPGCYRQPIRRSPH